MIDKIKSSIEMSTNRVANESVKPQPPENPQGTQPEMPPKQPPESQPDNVQEALHDNNIEQPVDNTLEIMKATKRELAKAIRKNKFPCVVGKSVFNSSEELLGFNSDFLQRFDSEKKAAKKNKLKAAKKDFEERFAGRAEELNLKRPRKEFDDENYNIDSDGFVRRLSKPIGVVSGDSVIEIPKTNKEERKRFLSKHESELRQSKSPKEAFHEVIEKFRDTDDDAFKHSHQFSSDKTFSSKVINDFLEQFNPPKVVIRNNGDGRRGLEKHHSDLNPKLFESMN